MPPWRQSRACGDAAVCALSSATGRRTASSGKNAQRTAGIRQTSAACVTWVLHRDRCMITGAADLSACSPPMLVLFPKAVVNKLPSCSHETCLHKDMSLQLSCEGDSHVVYLWTCSRSRDKDRERCIRDETDVRERTREPAMVRQKTDWFSQLYECSPTLTST